MFRIFPLTDEKLKTEYLKKCTLEQIPSAFVYAMCDSKTGELMGLSQFDILGSFGYIYNIKEAPQKDDYEAMFILTKQTMSFIESCGAETCRATLDAADSKLLTAAGFRKNEDYYFATIKGMFDGHCSGHK